MISSREKLLKDIEVYLERTGATDASFGLAFLNDSSFVNRLRNGRQPRADMMDRCYAAMAEHPKGPPAPAAQGAMS